MFYNLNIYCFLRPLQGTVRIIELFFSEWHFLDTHLASLQLDCFTNCTEFSAGSLTIKGAQMV